MTWSVFTFQANVPGGEGGRQGIGAESYVHPAPRVRAGGPTQVGRDEEIESDFQ